MRDKVLDDLLADWHIWSSGYSVVPMYGACAMFKAAKSPKHHDTTADIADDAIHRLNMDAMDFTILGDKSGYGGLVEPYRAAVTCYARNLVSKVAVWASPRLPTDRLERIAITNKALEMLENKLKILDVL